MLSLERFAEVRAAIERGEARDAVLRARGITPAEWIQLQRHWLDALASEITQGRDTLATRYCRAFESAHPAAASAEKPAAAEPDAPASGVVPLPVPAAPAPVLMPDVPAPGPAYLPPAPIAIPQGTMMAFESPIGPAVPFREGAPAQPLPPAAPRPDPSQRISTGTALTFEVPRGPATPFQGEPGKGASAPVPPAAAMRPGTGTAWAPSAPSSPATPFQAPEPETLGFTVLRYSELVAAREEAGANMMAEVLARFGIDAAGHAQVEAFWQRKFSENGLLALDFGRHLEQAKKGLAERRKARTQAPIGSGTVMALDVPRAASPEPAKPATAPAAVSPATSPLPTLTVEQYAWLAASLRKATPAELPATLARFRLTPETRKELEEQWSRRMAADPELQQAFISALTRYLAGSGK